MMKNLYLCSCSSFTFPTLLHPHHQLSAGQRKTNYFTFTLHAAAKSGGVFSLNSCKTCKGQGAIECPGCKGTGKNKKNGNMFERWKCFDCQGFGLKSCPVCGKGGLTPEQRGER